MPFNFNAKQVYLTYAQSSFEKEELLSFMQEKFGVDDYLICKERHASGDPHIHAYFKFSRQIHSRDERVFDYKERHPNIKKITSAKARDHIKRYIQKDGDYITNIEVLDKTTSLFKRMLEEGLTKKFVIDNPSIMNKNFNSIMSWYKFVKDEPPVRRDLPKKRHVWLAGRSNTGKSTWLYAYLKLFEAYSQIPRNGDWNGINQTTDLLYFDEFKGHLTIQELNSICDGCTKLNTKGGSTSIGQPLVVIVSNYSISDCYNKADNDLLETLYNRFNYYDSSIRLPPFPTSEL